MLRHHFSCCLQALTDGSCRALWDLWVCGKFPPWERARSKLPCVSTPCWAKQWKRVQEEPYISTFTPLLSPVSSWEWDGKLERFSKEGGSVWGKFSHGWCWSHLLPGLPRCRGCISTPWLGAGGRTAAERGAACSRLTCAPCQGAAQRFCTSVYLCYSKMVPCHWDRKQLWTEISAHDGNVSSVMLFRIFF